MDPNEILSQIRQHLAEIARLDKLIALGDERIDEYESRDDEALDCARLVADLDEWITKGGSLPTEWGDRQPRYCPLCDKAITRVETHDSAWWAHAADMTPVQYHRGATLVLSEPEPAFKSS